MKVRKECECKMEISPKAIIKMKLANMDNLVRMAFFSVARNSGLNFLLYEDKKAKKWHIGFLSGVAGYFDLRGLPMYFYVELKVKPEKERICTLTENDEYL